MQHRDVRATGLVHGADLGPGPPVDTQRWQVVGLPVMGKAIQECIGSCIVGLATLP